MAIEKIACDNRYLETAQCAPVRQIGLTEARAAGGIRVFERDTLHGRTSGLECLAQ